MKTTFIVNLSSTRIAIADLMEYNDGMLLTRINVPKTFRGKGIGSKLLKQIIDEADKEKVKLYLTISPSDGLDFEQLEKWYYRFGFRQFAVPGFMLRRKNCSKVEK